jgi:tripartite-type tricarboxylate transporter receptor subunit TctC
MLKALKVLAMAFVSSLFLSGAYADTYPSKIVKLVVPYPPGGVVDITGRLLATELEKTLGGKVIVENKPGAGGTIGAGLVAKADPDGYTILLSGAATHAFAPSVYKNLPYDPLNDFVQVTQVVQGPLALCVNSSSPIKSLADFVKTVKTKGSDNSYSSNGNGTYPHLSVELMKQVLDVDLVHVAYKGGGQAVTALLGGEVQVSQNHIPIVLPHVKSNRLRVLATTGEARSKTFPDVPTLREAGVDVVASAWFGLFLPKGTPDVIRDKIYSATAKAAQSSDLREKLLLQGDEIVVEGPEKFRNFQISELAKWKRVIGAAGLQAK